MKKIIILLSLIMVAILVCPTVVVAKQYDDTYNVTVGVKFTIIVPRDGFPPLPTLDYNANKIEANPPHIRGWKMNSIEDHLFFTAIKKGVTYIDVIYPDRTFVYKITAS